MHELGLTQQLVETLSRAVVEQEGAGARVVRVVVEVGKLAAVLPDALRFCFDLCAAGTPLQGAILQIDEIPGRARCKACDLELLLDKPFGRCACGGSDLDWLSGDELRVTAMEVQPCA